MDVTAQAVTRSDRLDQFVFPSKIDVRFVLLIVAVLASSLIIYHLLSLQTHFQDFLDAASCALRQQPELKQALSAQGLSAFQKATDTVEQCGIPTQRIETDYMIGGDVLVVAVAVLIYWFFPAYLLRRRRLVSLSIEDAPEVVDYLSNLCWEMELTSAPRFVWNPLNFTSNPLAFGRQGHYYIAFTGGLIAMFHTDRAAFRAMVLHEMAHLRNADLFKTYFARAIWWAFVAVVLVPFAIYLVVGQLNRWDYAFTLLSLGFVTLLVVLVYLSRNAVLRAREFYADVRASEWDGSSVLSVHPHINRGWWSMMRVHPAPAERYKVLQKPQELFSLSRWEAFGSGFAIGIALPSVVSILSYLFAEQAQVLHKLRINLPNVQSLLSSFSKLPKGNVYIQNVSFSLDAKYVGAALVIAPLIIGIIGLSIWRATFATLVKGQELQGVGRVGLCLGLGLSVGSVLSLYYDRSRDFGLLVNPLFLFVLSLPWSIVVLVSLFLFLRWIAMGTSAWLDVMISSRSPRLFYTVSTVGLVISSGVLIVVLAQLFLFQLLATDIADTLGTTFDLVIGFPVVIFGSIVLLISDTLLSPGVLLAFICLWAFPLATWFWRKQVKTPVGSHWAFLGASSQPIVLPRQDPFRLRFALIVGMVGGLVFCALLLVIRIWLRMSVPEAIRSTGQFKLLLFYGIIVLAVLFQAVIAGVVAGKIRRLGSLHGLFAAFVGGCVMTAGTLGINLLFGGTASASFIWITFSFVINAGALLALPIVLGVSAIAHRIRKTKIEEVKVYAK
jgi:Zn-dependent protease with chaperone function